MKLVSFLIAIALGSTQVAFAAPAVFSTGAGAAACTANLALATTPTNGYVVAGILTGSTALTSVTIKDSNSVTLGNAQLDSTVYMANYVVSGSPTINYSFAATGTCVTQGLVEMSGAQFGSSSGSTSGTSSVTGVAGDIIVCAVKGTTTLGNLTTTITNAGTVTTLNTAATTYATGYATSTGGSSTCSASGTGATITATAVQDFTAASSTTTGCPPFAYPCVFKTAER